MTKTSSPARDLLIVFTGGCAGTLLRHGANLAFPHDTFPVSTLIVNIIGALLLGILVGYLSLRLATGSVPHQRLRLLLGTGLLGGFTTYSALALEVAHFAEDQRIMFGLGYGLITVVVGAVASFAGLILGRRIRHRQESS